MENRLSWLMKNIAHSAQILCDILQLPYSIFTIDKWHNAPEKVNQLKIHGVYPDYW